MIKRISEKLNWVYIFYNEELLNKINFKTMLIILIRDFWKTKYLELLFTSAFPARSTTLKNASVGGNTKKLKDFQNLHFFSFPSLSQNIIFHYNAKEQVSQYSNFYLNFSASLLFSAEILTLMSWLLSRLSIIKLVLI